MKKRIIPTVPKEERVSFDLGYHNIPRWLIFLLVISIFSGILCILFC